METRRDRIRQRRGVEVVPCHSGATAAAGVHGEEATVEDRERSAYGRGGEWRNSLLLRGAGGGGQPAEKRELEEIGAVLNQGDQGGNLIAPSLTRMILIPDLPDIQG